MLKTLVLAEWRSRKVTDITPTDVDRLLTKVAAGRPRVWKTTVKPIPSSRVFKTKQSEPKSPPKTFKPTPVRANRAGEVLRKMFSLVITWKMRADNPATSFRKRPETARERFSPSRKSNASPTPSAGIPISAPPGSSGCAC